MTDMRGVSRHRSDVGYLLNRVTRQLRHRLGDALEPIGLTPQQAAVLMALARSEGQRLTPSALAEAIETDAATTSGLLERLTRDGWLTAQPNPDDGRSRLVGLTEKAEEALSRVIGAADAVTAEATASLSAEEVDTLARLLSKVCDNDETRTPAKKAGTR